MQDKEKKLLINFIQKHITKKEYPNITEETLLFKGGILDSMNILDLIGFVEKRIGRKLNDEEVIMDNFKDVNSIVEVFFHEQ